MNFRSAVFGTVFRWVFSDWGRQCPLSRLSILGLSTNRANIRLRKIATETVELRG